MTTLYETLGVARDATPEEIKAAYRKAAMRSHPDREGGSKEAFQAVQRAGEILLDEAKRAHYDATGDDSTADPAESLESRVRGMFADVVFNGMMMMGEEFEASWRKTVEQLGNIAADMTAKKANLEKLVKQFESRSSKLTHKGGEHSGFLDSVQELLHGRAQTQLTRVTEDLDLILATIARAGAFEAPEPTIDADALARQMLAAFEQMNQQKPRANKSFFSSGPADYNPRNKYGSSYGPQR